MRWRFVVPFSCADDKSIVTCVLGVTDCFLFSCSGISQLEWSGEGVVGCVLCSCFHLRLCCLFLELDLTGLKLYLGVGAAEWELLYFGVGIAD